MTDEAIQGKREVGEIFELYICVDQSEKEDMHGGKIWEALFHVQVMDATWKGGGS